MQSELVPLVGFISTQRQYDDGGTWWVVLQVGFESSLVDQLPIDLTGWRCGLDLIASVHRWRRQRWIWAIIRPSSTGMKSILGTWIYSFLMEKLIAKEMSESTTEKENWKNQEWGRNGLNWIDSVTWKYKRLRWCSFVSATLVTATAGVDTSVCHHNEWLNPKFSQNR